MVPTWSEPVRGGTLTVRILGDDVVRLDSAAKPSRSVRSLLEAFRQPHLLLLRSAQNYFELVAAVAALLQGREGLAPLDARRLAFWRHYEPARLAPRRFEFESRALGGRLERTVLELGPLGLEPSGRRVDARDLLLPDDAFFHGPPRPGMPLEQRITLRSALYTALAPGSGLAESEGFALLDYARVERKSWRWNESERGSEDAVLEGAVLAVGYQFAQDFGVVEWPVERALSGAPDFAMPTAPPSVLAELRDALEAARLR